MNTKAPWSEQDFETAAHLWTVEGLTAGMISQALDYRYSRNAILGKMHREGLGRSTPPKPPKKTGPKPVPLEVRIKARHMKRQRPTMIANALKIKTERVVEILEKLGLDPREHYMDHYQVHPMWAMFPDEQREAFKAKYQRGLEELRNA